MTLLRLPDLRLSSTRGAILCAAVFGVLWTVIEVSLGGRLRQDYNPIEVVWWRYGVHLALMGLIWGFTRPQVMVRTRRPLFHFLRSLMMLIMPGAYVVGYYLGAPPAFMWSAFWTAPVVIMLMSWLWLGERPSALWLALGFAGALAAAMVYGHVRPPSLTAVACAAAMNLSFSAYYVMTRALHTERREANLFYTALGPFIVLSCVMPMVWTTPGLHDALIMIAIGVVGFVALYALDMACHTASAAIGALGLFAHIPAIALADATQRAHMTSRDVAGFGALVVLLVLAWVLAGAARSFQITAVRSQV